MASVPFLTIFPGCEAMEDLCGGLDKAFVRSVEVEEQSLSMTIFADFSRAPAQAELTAVEARITEDYGLSRAVIQASFPKDTGKSAVDEVLMGRKTQAKTVTPIGELTADSGNVTITGSIFFVDSRDLAKNNATILTFDITDYTGSVRCTKFLKSDEEKVILGKLREGDYVTVSGSMSYSRYEEDMTLEPRSIWRAQRPMRQDTSVEKHIELHLHTRFSNTDALTDPKAVVKRAADWGMPAIAVTDHGVVQAFPDLWHAGKDYGVKIIYGVEGYFVDDMNVRQPVWGKRSSLPLDSEFIAFDIETTGLSAANDRMTEIGAVLFEGDQIKDHFQCFVNPHMPIPPEIKKLTGITDEDVKNAPDEDEAMRRFLEFVGGHPLIAHNAEFDTGFVRQACMRSGIEFDPTIMDTLVLAQCLMPDLKRFKLDIVSHKLKLPEFNHHRAYDDAAVVARIMGKFIPMLQERGAKTVDDVNAAVADLHRLDVGKTHHICLLARNKAGLKNLYKIISDSQIKYYNKSRKHPTMPRSLIQRYREGIFIGSACEAGELYEAVLRGNPPEKLEKIASFYDYLEIMPLFNNRFLIENDTVRDDEDLKELNRRIIALGKKLDKPVVATCDVHFLDPEDEIYRKILLASKKFSDADKPLPIYFRTTDEVMAEFAYLGEDLCHEVVIDNPKKIADQVEEFELLPKDLFAPKIENSKEELERLVMEKMHRIYGENPDPIVTDRVNTELRTILDHEYDVIYMSAQKLVQNSMEHGYLVGSRGSVGSSLVAYMSGITEVNSLPPHYVCPNCKHTEFITDGSYGCGADMPDKVCACGTKYRKDGFDIPFETFLGFPGNEKTPDIDLNFSGEYQADAHNYTRELFGSDHVFKAGTIGTLADKTAFGMVKKYLEERGITVTKAEENRLSKGCVGVKRTTGQHPGGLVIIPQDMEVTDFCPIQWAAEDPECGIMTTHFEYHCMENNLLKLDELGHDDPTMIRMLEDMTHVSALDIQLDDPETMGIFRSPEPLGLPDTDSVVGKTGTLGIPEFGTGFTRGMLVDTLPTQFDTLVRLAGLAHGTDVWNGNIHDIVVSGTATVNECVCCRDDIMIYLIQRGMEPSLAFKTMEAVRKGKVKKSGSFPGDAEAIMKDMKVPEWYIESCRKIAYLFPKAHAVAYVMMAFRIAWFKVHYPLAFYAAYFYRRSQKNAFDAELMTQGIDKVKAKINELRNKQTSATEDDILTTLEVVYEFYLRGFSFAPMSITDSDAVKFTIVGDQQLRAPFVSIGGLGEAAAFDLAAASTSGQAFVSVEELSSACPKVSQTHLQALKDLGALGDLPDTSQMTLF